MERANASSAGAQATSVIPASGQWTGIPTTATPARTRATAELAGAPASGDGSKVVQMLWGGSVVTGAAKREAR